jgi:hypothetical protein
MTTHSGVVKAVAAAAAAGAALVLWRSVKSSTSHADADTTSPAAAVSACPSCACLSRVLAASVVVCLASSAFAHVEYSCVQPDVSCLSRGGLRAHSRGACPATVSHIAVCLCCSLHRLASPPPPSRGTMLRV